MKLYKYFFRILFFILPFVCLSINLFPQEYYPLQIGNRWDFVEIKFNPITWTNDTSYVEFKMSGDSLFPNGNTYFIIENYDLTLGGKYIRSDGNDFFYYDENENGEDTLFRTDVEIGDQWEVQFNVTMHVSVESIDTITIFGYSSRVITYRLDGLILFYVSLSDKFGPVIFNSPGEPPGTLYTTKLILGCIIDGIRYGSLVSVPQQQFVTKEFALSQNYPNPFNPTTRIQYSIGSRQFVSLKVYNVLGKEIATLVNEEKPAGSYEADFDAIELPSGIYLYTLHVGEFIQLKKMLFLK